MDRTAPTITWDAHPRRANNEKGCVTNGLTAIFNVHDGTSGFKNAYYYYGQNNQPFDNTIINKVSQLKGSGEADKKYTDVWTSSCSHSINCTGCFNNTPGNGSYWHKVKAYDKAGNMSQKNSNAGSK